MVDKRLLCRQGDALDFSGSVLRYSYVLAPKRTDLKRDSLA